MNALILTDLSPAGLASVESIGACGPSAFDTITLLHVIDLDPYTAGGSMPQIAEWAATEMERVASTLRDRWYDVTVRVEQGSVIEVVDQIADEIGADLIAMTNVGKGAVSGRLLGSTAERLASGSNKMVLVERATRANEQWCRLGAGSPFEALVVGIDDIPGSVEFIERIAALPGVAKLTLLHVASNAADLESSERALSELVWDAPALVEVGTSVVSGDAAEQLIAEARRMDASAIVVAPVSHNVLRRGVLGSVSHKLLSKADRAVVLVPRS